MAAAARYRYPLTKALDPAKRETTAQAITARQLRNETRPAAWFCAGQEVSHAAINHKHSPPADHTTTVTGLREALAYSPIIGHHQPSHERHYCTAAGNVASQPTS